MAQFTDEKAFLSDGLGHECTTDHRAKRVGPLERARQSGHLFVKYVACFVLALCTARAVASIKMPDWSLRSPVRQKGNARLRF